MIAHFLIQQYLTYLRRHNMTPLQKEFITDCLWDKFEKCDKLPEVESLAEFCTELDLEYLGEVFVNQWHEDWLNWVDDQREKGLFI